LMLEDLSVLNEEGEEMVGNIFKLTIIAMEFYSTLEENPIEEDEELSRIYHEELRTKDYHILDRELSEGEDHLLSNTEIYLKQASFSREEAFEWIDKLFVIKGFPKSEMEEGSINDFLELNPIMRLFSLDNVKKFEDELGEEWWKSDK